jgi:hypothetical protein
MVHKNAGKGGLMTILRDLAGVFGVIVFLVGSLASSAVLLGPPVSGAVVAVRFARHSLLYPPRVWSKSAALTVCVLSLFTVIASIAGGWSLLVFALVLYFIGFAGALRRLFRASFSLSFKIAVLVGALGLVACWVMFFHSSGGEDEVGRLQGWSVFFGGWVIAVAIVFVLISAGKRIIRRLVTKDREGNGIRP